MARRGVALGVVALIAIASACSSDADADPEPTRSEPIDTRPETTQSVETDPTTTPAPAPTTAAPTTAAPTTDAPTTTIDEAALVAEVEAAYFAALDAYYAALADPGDPGLREQLANRYTSNGQDFVLEAIDSLEAANRVARPHPELDPFAVVTGPVRFEGSEYSEASLIACEILPQLIYEVEGGPNGEDALLRDDVLRTDVVVVLRLDAGEWRIAGGEPIRELVGVESCDSV